MLCIVSPGCADVLFTFISSLIPVHLLLLPSDERFHWVNSVSALPSFTVRQLFSQKRNSFTKVFRCFAKRLSAFFNCRQSARLKCRFDYIWFIFFCVAMPWLFIALSRVTIYNIRSSFILFCHRSLWSYGFPLKKKNIAQFQHYSLHVKNVHSDTDLLSRAT